MADCPTWSTRRVTTKRIMTVMLTVMTRFPAYATAMRRVQPAGLPEAAQISRDLGRPGPA